MMSIPNPILATWVIESIDFEKLSKCQGIFLKNDGRLSVGLHTNVYKLYGGDNWDTLQCFLWALWKGLEHDWTQRGFDLTALQTSRKVDTIIKSRKAEYYMMVGVLRVTVHWAGLKKYFSLWKYLISLQISMFTSRWIRKRS